MSSQCHFHPNNENEKTSRIWETVICNGVNISVCWTTGGANDDWEITIIITTAAIDNGHDDVYLK